MTSSLYDPIQLDRLRELTGVDSQPTTYSALESAVSAFMSKVPFENISKLYYFHEEGLRDVPDLKKYIDGIEQHNFGGTCYSNNRYLNGLLNHLGYDAILCGADMNKPDVHMVNVVRLEGREFLVDAGYAAPFLRPLPLDSPRDIVIESGRDRYELKPRDNNGHSRMDLIREGELSHGYTVKPTPREPGHFDEIVLDSFRPDSTFLNSLLLVRFWPGKAKAVHNLNFFETTGTEYSKSELPDRQSLIGAIVEHFEMPADVVERAVSNLNSFGDSWT